MRYSTCGYPHCGYPDIQVQLIHPTKLYAWLIWNLTGGVAGGKYVTDCSNASRTMLMNLKAPDWYKPTLDVLGVPVEILPKIISNSKNSFWLTKLYLLLAYHLPFSQAYDAKQAKTNIFLPCLDLVDWQNKYLVD
jgi:glycerol kinase